MHPTPAQQQYLLFLTDQLKSETEKSLIRLLQPKKNAFSWF